MKWLLAGASGFLGTALRVRLAGEGQEVVRLVRREPATSTEFQWDPDSGTVDATAFQWGWRFAYAGTRVRANGGPGRTPELVVPAGQERIRTASMTFPDPVISVSPKKAWKPRVPSSTMSRIG